MELPEEEIEYATTDFIHDEIKALRAEIKTLRERKKKTTESRKASVSEIGRIKKDFVSLQRKKNCFCSLRRNDYSRDALKNDFREGLQNFDEAAALERDPNNFDPNVRLRDYDSIDLPVFTVSSRDYVRVTKQVTGDGDPTVFDVLEDTGIPKLQDWCHQLTKESRGQAALNYHRQIQTFATSVQTYVSSITGVSATDRIKLQRAWGTDRLIPAEIDFDSLDSDDSFDSDDSDDIMRRYAKLHRGPATKRHVYGRNAHREPSPELLPQKKRYGRTKGQKGITNELIAAFEDVTTSAVEDLNSTFSDGLEEKCNTGARKAAAAAYDTSQAIAGTMHWATYRATLRRHGVFRTDMNAEFCQPMTSSIAREWSAMFAKDLFSDFSKRCMQSIDDILRKIEKTAPDGLKDKCRAQGVVARNEANTTLESIVAQVNEALMEQQKDLSRMLAPKIQKELEPGYDNAMRERGTGSVARQKAIVHNYVKDNSDDIFDGGAELLMKGLSAAATRIGILMDEALESLSQKVEVALSVLWDVASDSREQIHARQEVTATVMEIIDQLRL